MSDPLIVLPQHFKPLMAAGCRWPMFAARGAR